MIIKAKKDLVNDEEHVSFTKGQIYAAEYEGLSEYTLVIDNQGDMHSLGKWYKDFEIV